MKVILDGFEGMVEPENEKDVREFIGNLRDWLAGDGKVILQISADDVPLTPENSEKLMAKAVAETDILSVTTVSSQQKIVDLLTALHEHIPVLTANLRSVAVSLRVGDDPKTFDLFARCLEMWRWNMEAFRELEQLLHVDYQTLVAGKQTIALTLKEMVTFLDQCENAFRKKDMVTVADIIAYELADRLDVHAKIAEILAGIAREKINGNNA